MKQRILTGSAIVAVVFLALLCRQVNLYIFDALLISLSIMSVLEMNNILSKQGKYNNLLLEVIYCAVSQILLIVLIMLKLEWYYIILILFGVFVLFGLLIFIISLICSKTTRQEISVRKLNISKVKFSIKKALNSLICFIYPTLFLSLFIVINHISNIKVLETTNLGLFLITITIIIPVFVDTFAMLTGSLIGGKKLCPKISPNKTISGAIGGLIWGTIGAVLTFVIFNAFTSFQTLFTELNIKIWHFAIVGFIGSIISQIGDIFESYLKRKADLKDSGNALPGHGGFLDRIDSHIFNVIVVLIYIIILL